MFEYIADLINKEEYNKGLEACRRELKRLAGEDSDPGKEPIVVAGEDADMCAELALYAASALTALGSRKESFLALSGGIGCRSARYDSELSYMLGLWYLPVNPSQAMLCFERALKSCTDPADRQEIEKSVKEAADRGGAINPISVIILSYNQKDLMKQCLEAVKKEISPEDEIIVVDNASTDGVVDFLRDQDGIRLIESGDNVGFAPGCNIGFLECSPGRDILLLNNDAVLTRDSLFYLRMGLYEDRSVGATGPVSNNALEQTVDLAIDEDEYPEGPQGGERPLLFQGSDAAPDLSAYMLFGDNNNIPSAHPYENRARLTGFCVLIRREAADNILIDSGFGLYGLPEAAGKLKGKRVLLDNRFSPAYFEDDDLGVRLCQAGYRCLLCYNSFVYHKGGARNGKSFGSGGIVLEDSRLRFKDKWGFDIWNYEGIYDELIAAVGEHEFEGRRLLDNKDAYFTLLEIDCGFGANLSSIAHTWKNSDLYGMEENAIVAGLGRYMARITSGRIEPDNIPGSESFFDLICACDIFMRAEDPYLMADKLSEKIREGGLLILSRSILARSVLLDHIESLALAKKFRYAIIR
ncbi:glycosyltransferase [Butyrivibrio sp. MC2013]|uniref:glycosyltransferase n=1 Tax=Butyrivibrio sp. MC2013 TaxID=1280686 RepID=UPI00040454ED|nr:glycosyltransferase [Butyrivibrio sp. MC2013]